MKEYSAQTSLNRNRQDYSDFKHLFSKGEWATLRKTWRVMLARCMNYADPNYGGRGISVCAEWRSDFVAFATHIGPRPSDTHSVDRINNNGNYEPGNVRWATKSQQLLNRRPIPLTPRQTELLSYVVREAPSFRQIAKRFAFQSTNGVFDHIAALTRKGYLAPRPKYSRGFVVTDKGLQAIQVAA